MAAVLMAIAASGATRRKATGTIAASWATAATPTGPGNTPL